MRSTDRSPRWHRWPTLFTAIILSACAITDERAPLAPGRVPTGDLVGLATVPSQFADQLVAGGLASPTLMAIAPDGRIFVSEQGGAVRVIKNGVLLPTPFVTLSVNSSGERGVLGIAFDPAFTSNQHVYVYYTASAGPHNRVSRFTASGDVSSGGETPLLDLPTLSGATNHNGGALEFAPDGTLLIAVGDNANGALAQSFTSPMGKMLRINADGSIPTSNPFFGTTTGINRAIWALGLRNPFTFAIQPGTGRTFINDVGQSTWEEVNEGAAGANYGWPTTEGPTSDPRFVSPFYSYNHSSGCAITGGDFYNPANATFPSTYAGDYFFADYCSGWIRSLDLATRTATTFASGIQSPTDVRVGDDGALYYIERGTGSVRRITYTGSTAPNITQQPSSQTVPVGGTATFTVVASGSAPLAYQWQRNGVDIVGATQAAYQRTNVQQSDNGARFRCIVSNGAGSATSAEAVLTVTVNSPPSATITAPVAGTTFAGGQVITYNGTATDPEDGTLGGAAFTWTALLFHDDGSLHSHPFYGPASGTGGTFTIPTQGETSPNIWYRVYLRVTDSQGASVTDSVDIQPRLAVVTLATAPAGLQLTLDGTPVTAPFSFTGVVGIQRSIGAVSPQVVGGTTWSFNNWSDGGGATHTISTPASATTYTATFTSSSPTVYEAELARRSGANVMTTYPGFTGTGYVAYSARAGSFVEFTVNAAAAGSATLDVRYALEAPAAVTRTLSLSVNGVVVNGALGFTGTGSWSAWQLRSAVVTLQAGVNRVRLTRTTSRPPNIDHLVVR